TVNATDVENDTITYAITAGNPGNAFAIDPATGQITVATTSAIVSGPLLLTVTATDSGTPGASDTATVTVNVNTPPVVATPIDDIARFEDADPVVIDLTPVFSDAQDPVSALTYSIELNSDPALTSATIVGTTLTLTPVPNANGTTLLSVRA